MHSILRRGSWFDVRRVDVITLLLAVLLCTLAPAEPSAHGVADDDQAFIERSGAGNFIPFIYLGAKHMVTGYDHLLFLVDCVRARLNQHQECVDQQERSTLPRLPRSCGEGPAQTPMPTFALLRVESQNTKVPTANSAATIIQMSAVE